MRRTIAILVSCTLLLSLVSAVSAQPVSINIDGQAFDHPIAVIEGMAMVPLRPFAEALGATVHWDNGSVTLTRDGRTISLRAGAATAEVDGSAVPLPQPVSESGGRLMAPLKFLAEAFGAEAQWDDATQTADITTNVGGTITLSLGDYVDSLIPNTPLTAGTAALFPLIYDSLMAPDEQMNLHPSLASSYTVEDGRTYVFHLRDDVLWHDGRPFTARDVAFTFHALAHPDGWYGGLPPQVRGLQALIELYHVPGVRPYEEAAAQRVAAWDAWTKSGAIQVRDDLTVAIELAEPFAPAFAKLVALRIMPEHLLSGQDLRALALKDDWKPVGTGPYRVTEWERDARLVLERNPAWKWGALGHHTRIDRLIIWLLPDSNTQVVALEAGEVDVAPLTPPQAERIRLTRPDIRVLKHPSPNYTYLGYNLKDPILGDVQVRRAITHAIDRKALIDQALNGHGLLANNHSLPGRWDENTSLPVPAFDPAGAEALLKEAGWEKGPDGTLMKDGQRLSFEIATNAGNRLREAAAVSIQAQLRKVGMDVRIILMDWNRFLEYVDGDRKQAYILGWSTGADPDPHVIFHSAGPFNGMTGYHNPRADHLIEQARVTTDQEKRAALYQELWQMLADDQVYTWLFYPYIYTGVSQRVQGIMTDRLGHVGPLWQMANWWVIER